MCDEIGGCEGFSYNNWIALVYKLPAIPSKFRVSVWREMKKYGAIYLQQSVAVLPNSERCKEIFAKLKEKIVSYSGEATLLDFSFADASDAITAYKSYNNGLSKEFDLLCEVRNKILDDLEAAKKANRVSLEDLKGKLADLKKLKRNYNSILLRDCYNKFLTHPFERHLNELISRVRNDIENFENSEKYSSND